MRRSTLVPIASAFAALVAAFGADASRATAPALAVEAPTVAPTETPHEEVADDPVALARAAREVLAANCYACHGPDAAAREAELRLDTADGLATPTLDGAVVTPGDPAASTLLARVRDDDDPMPPVGHGERLAPDEVDLLERWIASGGALVEHWAFVQPERASTPDTRFDAWVRDPLDAFVAHALEERGLAPSPPADRATWLRRASLDLIGLPPTPERVAAFVADEREDAFERAVDELLADPGFGERWASVWLDLARYADTCGYGMDLPRTIWPWRDWVVRALNANVPFDRFTVLQLAGDLVEDADDETRLATAFHRNTLNNTEGGTDDEEFRQMAVKDRVDTTMGVWLGQTAGCARCHDHKFDPLSQREYYELFDLFNQTADRDTNDDAPTMATPTAAERARLEAANARVAASERVASERLAAVRERLGEIDAQDGASMRAALEALAAGGASDRWTPEPGARSLTRTGGDATGAATGPGSDGVFEVKEAPSQAERWEVAFDLEGDAAPLAPAGVAGFGLVRRVAQGADGAALGPVPTRASLAFEGVPPPAAPVARVVVQAPGSLRALSFAEVEVWSAGADARALGRATQSSTTGAETADRALDGDADTLATTGVEDGPTFAFELATPAPVARVVLTGRPDGRTRGAFVVRLEDASGATVFATLVEFDGSARTVEVTTAGRVVVPLAETRTATDASAASGSRPFLAFTAGWLPARANSGSLSLFVRPEHAPWFERFELVRRVRGAALAPDELDAVAAAIAAVHARGGDDEALARAFAPVSGDLTAAVEALDAARRARDEVSLTRSPVMVELPEDERRTTRVHERGNWLAPGEVVHAGVPDHLALPGEPEPTNRLELARLIVDPRHPLTGRVTVNRLWARLFGRGIVLTEEDFGTSGARPTHPELLDLLALDFVEGGWDVKAFCRRLVLSATYRQSSVVDAERRARDPENAWLSRGPRKRLEAEMVRDAALSVSGLLDRTLGGPPVFPPQPDGMWQVAFYGGRGWETSTGRDRYRRDLYTFLRRTQPYHTRTAFDGTSREVCTHRRIGTNTPLQALITLNDPVFVEAAQALARRMLDEAEGDASRLARGLELSLARPADPRRVAVLAELLATARRDFAARPDDARRFATEPLGALPGGTDPVEAAAFTLVANVLLNQDAFLVIE